MELRVNKAGLVSTVQDLGRPRHRSQGIPLGGAADSFALRVANLLVGNPEGAACVEMTLSGGEVEFSEETLVCVTGARFDGIPSWHPFVVHPREPLRFGRCVEGCRAYLAVAGGIDCPVVLGGRGTFLRGGFGGHGGRALVDGDVLPVAAVRRRVRPGWRLDPSILPAYSLEPVIRVLPGAHAGEFPSWPPAGLFRVDARSDRMGVRLHGIPMARLALSDILSTAVAPGTIQVPGDGNPIVLLADAQTLGGYPQVAHIISVDLPLAAQLRPGGGVRFVEASLDEAHSLAVARERDLGMLRQGLAACIQTVAGPVEATAGEGAPPRSADTSPGPGSPGAPVAAAAQATPAAGPASGAR